MEVIGYHILHTSFCRTSSLLDLNLEDKDGWTPLHHAAKNNALKSIEFLLDHGVDDVRLNKQNEAAIHVAVIHNQLEALKVRF